MKLLNVASHGASRLALQPFWRLTRGKTLGVQAVVVDDNNQILLVRHGYRPGWHFPGGGVKRNENLQLALGRELEEETGVKIETPPELFGIYANFEAFPGDHIVLFIVREWTQARIPKANLEIVESGFFPVSDPPVNTTGGTARRLQEIFYEKTITEDW